MERWIADRRASWEEAFDRLGDVLTEPEPRVWAMPRESGSGRWDLNIVGYEPGRQVEVFEKLAAAIGLTPRS